MQLRRAVLALTGVLAACAEAPRPDAQRGVSVPSASELVAPVQARTDGDRGVTSTDAALLVEESR